MGGMATTGRKYVSRVGAGLLAVAVLVVGFLFLDSGRPAPSAGGPGEAGPRPAVARPAAEDPAAGVAADPLVRSVVEARPEPEPAPAVAEGPYPDLEAWRSSREALLEGRLVATRGIQDWRGWQLYVTSFAPPPFLYGNKNTTVSVDARTGTFRQELPVGAAEILWYHSAVGKGPTRELFLESGSNSLTLDYDGPDPLSAIFVDVGGGTISANHVSATLPETGQVFWAMDFLEDGRFVIPGLAPEAYTVRIDAPGYAVFEVLQKPGGRLRVDLEEL